jgi:tetratricopeptide (TPR) repeat protein
MNENGELRDRDGNLLKPDDNENEIKNECNKVQASVDVDDPVADAKKKFERDPIEAQRILNKVIGEDESHVDAHFQLARLLSIIAADAKTTKAEDTCRLALKGKAGNPCWKVLDNLTINQYTKVLEILKDEAEEKDATLAPEGGTDIARKADVYFNRGSAYMSVGDYDNAMNDFKEWQGLSPTSDDRVLTNLGIIYDRKKPANKADKVVAQKYLGLAINMNPNNSVAREELKISKEELAMLENAGR